MDLRFERVKRLFKDDFKRFQELKIIVLGVGGVGGYAVDCLLRSGFKDITIVDNDYFDITNLNRQIGSENIGDLKVDFFKKLYPNIKTINKRVTTENINEFNFNSYDLIIDAIDDIAVKVELISKFYNKIISSMGSANRINPLKIGVTSIWKTFNDPFAKAIRYRLKKIGFNKDIEVIFSSELPISKNMGTFVAVTGSFGLVICAEVIKKIQKEQI